MQMLFYNRNNQITETADKSTQAMCIRSAVVICGYHALSQNAHLTGYETVGVIKTHRLSLGLNKTNIVNIM